VGQFSAGKVGQFWWEFIIINDLDRSIYAFWHSVLHQTERLSRLIMDTPLDITTWRAQLQIQKRKRSSSLLKLGFSTFYLNRTNRSGIISGGPIGGINQAGDWKIDCRFNRSELVQRIQKIARYRNRIELHNQDAIAFLQSVTPDLPPRSLVYLDPPYFSKGSELYVNYYKEDDHKTLSTYVQSMPDLKWVVSYDDVAQIRSLYSSHKQIYYGLKYSASRKMLGKEVIIYSENLVVPESIRHQLPTYN
jgi:DNA adenine methylase